MAETAGSSELFHGQPSILLTHPCGDSLRVLLHGAHVLSWVASGRERFYLSTTARFDGRSAVRGGVPICFPQFNQRGPLPKHGFARNLPWVPEGVAEAAGDAVRLQLRLSDSTLTRVHWAQAFTARLTLELRRGCLQLTLAVHNSDVQPLTFTGALHSYLGVGDVAQASLEGLEGRKEWDAVRDAQGRAAARLRFDGEFDRVYSAPDGPLLLHDGGQALRIEQSPSWAETVVWTPGEALAQGLPDLADPARMLCVEAAQVMEPVVLPAGGHWLGWQRFTLA